MAVSVEHSLTNAAVSDQARFNFSNADTAYTSPFGQGALRQAAQIPVNAQRIFPIQQAVREMDAGSRAVKP